MDNNFDSEYLQRVIREFSTRLVGEKIINKKDISIIINFIEYSFLIDSHFDKTKKNKKKLTIINPIKEIPSQYLNDAYNAFIDSHEMEFRVKFSTLKQYLEVTSENIGIRLLIALIATLAHVDELTFNHKKVQDFIDKISIFSRISNDLLDIDVKNDIDRKKIEVIQKKSYDFISIDNLRRLQMQIFKNINKLLKNYKPHTKMQEQIFTISKEVFKLSVQTYVMNKESFWKAL